MSLFLQVSELCWCIQMRPDGNFAAGSLGQHARAMPQCPPVGVIVILTTKGPAVAVTAVTVAIPRGWDWQITSNLLANRWFPMFLGILGQPTGWLGTNPESSFKVLEYLRSPAKNLSICHFLQGPSGWLATIWVPDRAWSGNPQASLGWFVSWKVPI